MNGQCLITSVFLVSIAMMSGFPLVHGSAASPPVPSEVEGGDDATSIPEEVSANWWATVQDDIRQSEYHVTWQDHTYLPNVDASYHAANRACNLRTYFTPEGPVVIPRVWPEGAEAPSWRLGLRLTAWGREGALQPAGSASLHTETNRIEYRRETLTEWYLNDQSGLEQGFTIQSPLLPRSAAPLLLELSLTGDLTPQLTNDPSASSGQGGQALEFTTPGGVRVLRYSDLHAIDATGRDLPVHLRLPSRVRGGAGGGVILITVDDANAVYPVTIDSLSTSPDWTAESDQGNASFGISVGTAGDVNGDGYADVIVGAYYYDNGESGEGRAFVYHGSASGLSASPNWTAESDQAYAHFGIAVGTAGDVNGDGYADVIVGAYYYDNPDTDEGRAFVYHGSASGLSASPDWTAESDQVDAYFGMSVGTAGDVNGDGYADVIVGAWLYDNGEASEGRAFVYHGSASGLSAAPDWTAESDQAGAGFGISVGTAGDVNGDGYADVIVGASSYDNGEHNEGRAFVYHGSGSGLSATPNWTAESNHVEARFGTSVGTAGDVNGDGYADVIVGAHYYDDGPKYEGWVFVYHGSSTGLATGLADWTAQSDQASAVFGISVGTAGDVNGDGYADVIVGAAGYDNSQADEGRAYVYHGSASGLRAAPNWTAESDQNWANFGISVGTAGDVDGDGYADVIVGAYGYTNGEYREGRAFVYHGSGSGPSPSPDWTAESDQAIAYFGTSVGTAGDVNGDGYADVIVGANEYDNGQQDEGRVYVYHGSASGLGASPNWTAESDQTSARFGFSVGTAGDVNGDGYADVIVGADTYSNSETNEGWAFVWYGSASGLGANGNPLNADWTAESDQVNARFGHSVGTAGDVNGDGYADVIVGADWYDKVETDEGRAFVYHGSASGPSPSPDWTAESDQDDAYLGTSVGTAGDVNGDGYADVIVGAERYDSGQGNAGQASVYHGSASGLSPSPNWTAESILGLAYFGASVGTAGDVNGDGYADVIVGAWLYNNGEFGEGGAFVYDGSASGLSAFPNWTAEGDQDYAYFGISVGTAGDVNGDGYADVIVGASHYQNGQTDEGRAFVYHGSGSGLSAAPDWTAESDQDNARFGASVGTAGDVNGDGYAEVIVGAYRYESGAAETEEGWAFVYYGNRGAGLSLNPRQRRWADSAPVAPLGLSKGNAFRLALLGRTPFGRSKVKLEWEVKPLGTLFDGTGIQQSAAWMDSGTAGVELSELVRSLLANTVYHWRARLHYHPANTPFQQYSRWLTMPWNGWNEADLRTGEVLSYLYLPLVMRASP
jgi:hypothetical protein